MLHEKDLRGAGFKAKRMVRSDEGQNMELSQRRRENGFNS